ncbi:MAG: S41 family peptidase, partial [Burkholderiaceae bacterium]|nr:S41 family peptidase [Burkholderiaceae bacterium]
MKTLNRISLSVLSSFMLGCALFAPASFAQEAKKPLPLQEIRQFTDVYGAIKAFYVDPTKDEKLLENALAGMLNGLDPHSAYLDQEAFKDMKEGTQGEFG